MIILPKPWTRQSQFPVGINKAFPEPLTVLVPNGAVFRKATAYDPAGTYSGNTPSVIASGRAVSFAGGSSDKYQSETRSVVSIERTTYSFLVVWKAVASGANQTILGANGSLQVRLNASEQLELLTQGVALHGTSTQTYATSRDHVLGVTCETGGSTRVFCDGVEVITYASTIDIGNSDLQYVTLAGRGGTGEVFNGNIALFSHWSGVSLPTVVRNLTANPWPLFAPLPRRIFVDAPSGVTNPVGFGADTLEKLTEIATGRTGTRGTASDTLRALTESATGVVTSAQVGFASGALNALTDAATGRTGARGTAADTLKALDEQATGFTSVSPVGYATDTLKTLTDAATGRTGMRGTAADTLRAFNEAATGLAGALGNARDTLKTLTASATGTFQTNNRFGFGTDTLKALTSQATGRAGAVAGAVDTFKKLTEQAQGRTGMVGFSVDSLKALQAAAGAVSGAEPIAPPRTGGAPVWWPSKPGSRPWWYRDLKDKTDELERMRQLRIEMGILPKAEAKRIAKVVKEVDAFIEEIPTEDTADEYIARADALTERINALVDKIEEDDDEQTIMEMSRFFFHHRAGAGALNMHVSYS